jgi:hypothetical protein
MIIESFKISFNYPFTKNILKLNNNFNDVEIPFDNLNESDKEFINESNKEILQKIVDNNYLNEIIFNKLYITLIINKFKLFEKNNQFIEFENLSKIISNEKFKNQMKHEIIYHYLDINIDNILDEQVEIFIKNENIAYEELLLKMKTYVKNNYEYDEYDE